MRIENLFVHSKMPDVHRLRFLSVALGRILVISSYATYADVMLVDFA